MTETFKYINIERAGNILTATLNRPEQLNTTNRELHTELSRLFSWIAEDEESEVVVLAGAGKAFSAGGDLAFLEEGQADPAMFEHVLNEGKRMINAMLDLDKPIICRLHGDAAGLGATLALYCDIIIAADHVKILDPHVKVGLAAGDGGAVIWPQLIGYARAKQYLLTGDIVTAPEAAAMGLINFSVPADELDAMVDKWSNKLSKGASAAIRATKMAINAGLKQVAAASLETSFATEKWTARTDDYKEGLASIREKRKPVFKGY